MGRKRVLRPRNPRLGALGEVILRARKAAGISQATLGSLSGVHEVHVRGLERGVRNPSYETLLKIAESLGTTVGELTTQADRLHGEEQVRRKSGRRQKSRSR
jgi:transcriptional regulator with XRE-family HTH domain